jgi:cytoskeletal protein RodZ
MPDIPVTEFGARLKQARLARGVSLAQIASVTKISVRLLEAVERNDFSRLPGGIFTRAFVRAYAGEVGLDPEVALKQFLSQCPEDMAAVPTDAPESIDGSTAHAEWQEKLSWRHAAVVLAVIALLVTAWYAWMRPPRPDASAGAAAPPVVTAATEAPAPAQSAPVATSPAARSANPRPAPVPPAAGPAVTASGAPLSLSLATSAACWMSIVADGKIVASRLFAANERLDVPAERDVVLKVGDAAALALTINGRTARPLGASGQVVTVRITPDTWTSFLAGR